uniref:Myosin phosphatase Rho interacting protein n=1 Tax=Salarias fasciatus TaxID=181472 RepID=A0A672G1W5_SALFA
MSLKENPCRKFQANIFNKSKCQNCFKPRESHLLNDEDLNQAKPIYGGWLLLAPEGTNFDNPLHRSRKWQRRFFILYEHGLLRYALDEMPSTLPQGTINMNQCSDVVDGESRTGQKNSLCILTPEKEHFIRAECKEIINGWQEALTVYPRTNKQNQKKKRKVDPPTHQVLHLFTLFSVKHLYLLSLNRAAAAGRQTNVRVIFESSLDSDPSGATPTWEGHSGGGGGSVSVSGGGGRVGRSGREYAALSDVPRARRLTYREAFRSDKKRQELRTRTRSPGREEVARLFGEERRRSQIIGRFEEGQHVERMDTSTSSDPSADPTLRQGRSERRYLANKHPDLLNFKKGWMTKLYEDGVWKKHWFVLTDQSLRYYKDSIAEEASELDGEIDLSTCYDVKEFPVQRNYGFQILCKDGACTLSAMTSGIRRNWIQAIMKNVRPTIAPDAPKSDSLRQPPGNNASAPPSEPRKSRVRERRREGRSKTYDWTEFKMEKTQKPVKERADTSSAADGQEQGKMEVDHPAALRSEKDDKKDNRSPDVREEIEQRWHQVETTPLREEKQVPITTALANSSNSDRLPPHELAALLDKEVCLFAHLPFQHLHKLNQDLHGELESQKRKQDIAQQQIRTLKRSYTEAKDAADRHECDIQALQAKLASAMAEILASEQAVARMRNELKIEQDRSKEHEEEYARGEATLRAQLRDSEDRLREVEASLLERNQALRHLEHQQALQRDHMREIQRLQDRLEEVTARLKATEEGQALKEERLRKEQSSMQESHERERQTLCRRLAEAETAQKEIEEKLVEAEQQVEALLRGRRASGGKENREEMLKLQEDHLTCRCQELLNQIAEADREALVKMTALGNSLEETEQKLQAKEELLCQMSQSLLNKVEPCTAEMDLQAKLVVAEDRIAELEQHLDALKLGYADLRMEKQQHLPEQNKKGRAKLSSSMSTHSALSRLDKSTTEDFPDEKESQAKRPKIRFSSIQCQKYMSFEGVDTGRVSGAFVDVGQKGNQDISEDVQVTEGDVPSDVAFPHSSDPEKFIAIIHALETKLLATEDKLKCLTQNLEVQQLTQAEEKSQVGQKVTETKKEMSGESVTDNSAAIRHYNNALVCVENSREKVKAILSGSHDTTDSQLHSLSEIESDLFNASLYIRQGQKTEEQSSAVHQQQTPETIDNEALHLFAKTLSFEAVVLNKMSLLIQTSKSDLLQTLAEVWEEIEQIKRSDRDCLAVVYADVLTRKLMLESAFWKELEKTEAAVAKSKESSVSADVDIDATVVFNTVVKAELAYSIQNLKLCYEEKFKVLQRELAEAHNNLYQREMALKTIIEASKRPDLKSVINEVKNNFGLSKQKLADIRPPELAPYMEQIETEEAKDLAEEIVDRHLAGEMPSCGVDSVESLKNAHDNLANELQRQAAILHKYAQEIESGGSPPGLLKMIRAFLGNQSTQSFAGTSLCMREALIQAQVAYVACRLRAMHEQDLGWCKQTGQNMDALVQQHARNVTAIQEKYEASLQEERLTFTQTLTNLQKENQTLKSEISKRMNQLSQQQEQKALLEKHFQKETKDLKQRLEKELSQAEQGRASTEMALVETAADSQRKLEVLLVDMDTMEEQHENHVRKLEEQFEQRICELQHLHKEEIEKLHSQYVENIQSVIDRRADKESPESPHSPPCEEAATPMEEEEQGKGMSEVDSMVVLKDRIQELETQMNNMRDELENKHLEGDVASLREKYQRDFESLKATCERGFAAMEETHQKVIEDIQRQHQREISKLMEERERLLAEETAATIAAIEAMKNAHKEELEKTQRSQLSGLNSDIDELRLQYEEELQSIQRELEVLSEQYSQKCLENAHLAQALEAERQALRQCQRENQELNAHNQELNNRLTAEITRMRSCFSGETALSPVTQGKDVYELEVLLRIKESEIQYLKQEIHSLKDELQSALRDKKYATDKYKDIYTELSIVKAKADCDISKLKEKLLMATEALGERTWFVYIMKSKSNPDFMKKEQSTASKPARGVRSKSLKEGLTVQERMKLFEAKDSRKI